MPTKCELHHISDRERGADVRRALICRRVERLPERLLKSVEALLSVLETAPSRVLVFEHFSLGALPGHIGEGEPSDQPDVA